MKKEIQLKNINKTFGSQVVLNKISLDIKQGEFFTLVGPSGVGKTTLLKIIANIEQANKGELLFIPSVKEWSPCIMVFQDFMLFPHSTVLENISYGLHSQDNYQRVFSTSSRKNHKKKILQWVSQHLKDFGLEGLEKKYPAQLSAGQQQRVAIARAIIIQPALLLLDEPFANLDQNLKMETALFLKNIQRKYQLTVIAVTHDLEEAFAMSDRIGVMLNSQISQVGTPEAVYTKPLNQKVGSFLGSLNYLEFSEWSLCQFKGTSPDTKSKHVNILVRSEAIELIQDKEGAGIITKRTFLGFVIVFFVKINTKTIIVKQLSSSLNTNDRVSILIKNYVVCE